MLNVVAAVIVRGGKFFICKRPAGKHLGGYWEFPGGKAEAGETEEQALVRECGEELGVTVRPAGLLGRYVYAYPEEEISLALYFAEIVCGEIALKEGVLVARRHLHMHPDDAARYGLKTGDTVSIRCLSARPVILEDVAVRVSDQFATRVHIDFDEANGCGYHKGDLGRIVHG